MATIERNPNSLAARQAFRTLVYRADYGSQDVVDLRGVADLLEGSSRQFVIGWQPKYLRESAGN